MPAWVSKKYFLINLTCFQSSQEKKFSTKNKFVGKISFILIKYIEKVNSSCNTSLSEIFSIMEGNFIVAYQNPI